MERVASLTRDGVPFEFAANCMSNSELAGAFFSPDETTLFFNIFGTDQDESGCTCAVTGLWSDGPL